MPVKVTIHKTDKSFVFEDPGFLTLYKNFFVTCTGMSREDFIQKLCTCQSCDARQEARQVVPPEGTDEKDFVIVGRNPGNQEDIHGRPFYPDAPGGTWLQKYLEAMDMKRDETYVTNSLFCHTKRDRPPILTELVMCSVWKVVEFSFMKNMRYLLLMGNDAIRQFMGHDFPSVVRIFGSVYQMHFRGNPLLVALCYHPAYVLRRPALSEETFSYLKAYRMLVDADRKGELRW